MKKTQKLSLVRERLCELAKSSLEGVVGGYLMPTATCYCTARTVCTPSCARCG